MKNIFFITSIVILALVILLFILMLKKLINILRDCWKVYNNLSENKKDEFVILGVIIIFPIVILVLDYYNLFSRLFPNYIGLTRDYDWLSFIGTYFGTIISAILLTFITEKDRNENTNVLRESQRPYLDISYMNVDDKFFENNKNNVIIFKHGKYSDKKREKKEYLTLCIKNTGSSVAIIDTNKTKIKLSYKLNNKTVESELLLNFSINRLSIRSGEEVYIKFMKEELYKNGVLLSNSKIVNSIVYYKDLFNKEYYDECMLQDTLNVLHDNEEIK